MNKIAKTLFIVAVSFSGLLLNSLAFAKTDSIVLGMGCFWGAEKYMSKIPGVTDVESGYAGGDYKNATYRKIIKHERDLRRGKTKVRNHAEVIKVSFDDKKVELETILATFWETHDPTQGNRQGNDKGTTYRSAIYYHNNAQKQLAIKTRQRYQKSLTQAAFPKITTEIAPLKNYAAAEEVHQDYLLKNPNGYCALKGTKVAYPGSSRQFAAPAKPLMANKLNFDRQLIVFEGEDCPFCDKFEEDILSTWKSKVDITTTLSIKPPKNWKLKRALFATPTIVLFVKGKEVSRYTGYNGKKPLFWKWLDTQLVNFYQKKTALKNGSKQDLSSSEGAFFNRLKSFF